MNHQEPTLDLTKSRTREGAETVPDAAKPKPVTPECDHYEIRGELGHGGMGAVLRVWDRTLERELALKVLHEQGADRPDVVARFEDEAKISGRLQHPGVVPIHDLGRLTDGRPFFAMKLVDGQTLATLLAERANPATDRPRFLKIFEQVCQTLAYAHAQGIIHRDLKPLNIMVGAFGEVQVMDWGLAKVLHRTTLQSTPATPSLPDPIAHDGATIHFVSDSDAHSSDRTQAGSVMGTPSYMAPEQARGEVDRLDERTDVFGLGAMLCEILTGRPPFRGTGTIGTLGHAAAGNLTDAMAALDACGADHELIALAKACLAANQLERPRNGQAVADTLTGYLGSVQDRLRAVEIERAETTARAESERRRRRVLRTLLGVIGITVCLAVGTVLWLQRQAQQRRVDTLRATDIAFTKAEGLRDRARETPINNIPEAEAVLVVWQQSFAAIEQCEAAIASGTADDNLRSKVQSLREELHAGQTQTTQLLSELQRLTKLVDQLGAAREQSENEDYLHDAFADAGKAIRQAFVDFGVDLVTIDAATAAATLAATLPAFHRRIAESLTDWQNWDKTNADKIRSIAEQFDPDPWTKRFREALKRGSVHLRDFAESTRLEEVSPEQLNRLATACVHGYDRDYGFRFYRRIAGKYPDCYAINFDFASLLCHIQSTSSEYRVEALTYYRAAVACRPTALWTRHHLAGVLWKHGEQEAALAEFRACVAQRPDFVWGHARMSYHLHTLGRHEEALHHAKKALIRYGDIRIYSNIVTVFLHHRLYKEAQEAAQYCIDFQKQYLQMTRVWIAQFNDQGMLAVYDMARQADTKQVGVFYNLGVYFLFKMGDTERAEAALRRELAHNPKPTTTWYALADVLHRKGDTAGAEAATKKGIESNYQPWTWQFTRARICHEFKKVPETLASAKEALVTGAKQPQHVRSVIQYLAKNYGTAVALEHAKLAQANYPGNPTIGAEVAAQYFAARDYDQAIATLETLLAAYPNDQTLMAIQVRYFTIAGHLDRALSLVDQLLALNPKSEPNHLVRAEVLRRMGRHAECETAIGKARVTDAPPKQHKADTYAMEALLAAPKGHVPLAIARAEQAIEWHYLAVPSHVALGLARVRNGETAAGLQQLQVAIQVNRDNANGGSPEVPLELAQELVAYANREPLRAKLRNFALELMQSDLDRWTKDWEQHPTLYRPAVQRVLRVLQSAPAFASVRGPEAIRLLPQGEQQAWMDFWQRSATLQKRLEQPKP